MAKVVVAVITNISDNPLEVVEVGKPIKRRVRIDPGETSERQLVITPDLFEFLGQKTGFAKFSSVEELDTADLK